MTELIRRKNTGEAWETVVDTGGGGSQLGVSTVIGPYVVEYTDIVNLWDEVPIVTLPVGTTVISWWGDTATFIQFEEAVAGLVGNSVAMGQSAAFNPQVNDDWGRWGYLDVGPNPIGPGDAQGNTDASDTQNDDGTNRYVTLVNIVEALAIRAVHSDGGSTADFIAGHVEVYFLIATPTLILP